METAVLSVLGKGLITRAIGDLYSFMKDSTYTEHLESVMKDLDIKAELDVMEAMLEDLSDAKLCKTVDIAAKQVQECINSILTEFKAIEAELEYHNSRYFAAWRTPNYEQNILNLRKYKEILEKRRELLISVLSVQGNIHKSVTAPNKPPSPSRSFFNNF